MSTKSFKLLKNLTKDELTSKARTIEGDLFKARMQKVTGQLENVSSIWKMRKELARVKTLASQGNATPAVAKAKTAKATKTKATAAKAR